MKIFYKILSTILIIPFLLLAEGGPNGGGGGGGNFTPVISIHYLDSTSSDKYITEGDSGKTEVKFKISIDKCPILSDIIIKYYTFPGTATDIPDTTGSIDYGKLDDVVTFTKVNCEKSIIKSVFINGDTKVEANEKFYIRIESESNNITQNIKISPSSLTVNINNDDESANLAMTINTDKSYANTDDIVWYDLVVSNLGNSPTSFKVEDTFPSSLEILEVVSSDNSYTCSQSSNSILCQVPNGFVPVDQEKSIVRVKVRVATVSELYVANTASVYSTESLSDPDLSNNTQTHNLAVNPPGGSNIALTVKTAKLTETGLVLGENLGSAQIGDRVTFTITVRNQGYEKYLKVEDWIKARGTTYKAFDFDMSTLKVTDQKKNFFGFIDTVTCDSNYLLFSCKTKVAYQNEDSFTVTIEATVRQRGHDTICNHAHTYEFDGDNEADQWKIAEDNICFESTGNNPVSIVDIPSKETILGSDFSPFYLSYFKRDYDIIETFTYDITGLPPGLSMSTSGIITGQTTEDSAVNYPHDYNVTLTVTDSQGSKANKTFIIKVTAPVLMATDNKYNLDINGSANGNLIIDDTGDGVDTGYNITLKSVSQPAHGTLTHEDDGSFVYTTNDSTSLVSDSFTYTIIDGHGDEKTATVTLVIPGSSDGVDYEIGDHSFNLINPPATRNIVGNYVTIGNTVECVTDQTDNYNGNCKSQRTYYNNKYVVKYIDVDNDDRTWNSSSSNLTLPAVYKNSSDGKDILWAGLFWQGGVNNTYTYTEDSNTKTNTTQRRAVVKNNSFEYVTIDSSYHPDLNVKADTDANKVLLTIDDNATQNIEANETFFYYDNQHGNKGGYYATYADVTEIFQNAKLKKGKHKITVANITANEGKDGFVGNYAGWSLVVIYKEDPFVGTPRNISIYNGYKVIYGNKRSGGEDKIVQDIQITGFKLPKTGEVNAKLSVFAGEGELEFGSKSGEFDKIYLKENNNSIEMNVPASDPSNIFDSKLTNIDRDGGSDNNIENTNAIDIDDFDVSEIVAGYRANNANINSLIIGFGSNEDYLTVGMLAFAVELYKPSMCYDYTLSFGSYVVPSKNNIIQTPFGNLDDGIMTTRVSVQSRDGDFNLKDVKIIYDINETSMLTYKSGSTKIAPPGVNTYLDASSQTNNESLDGFTLNIGTGANGTVGGEIAPNEKRYFKFDDQTLQADLNTSFTIRAKYKVNFGSGDIEFGKDFSENDICTIKAMYLPERGAFNIASLYARSSGSNFGKPYNLNAQVVNNAFSVRLFSYDDNFESAKKFDGVVAFEPYNVDFFPNDTQLSCDNPDSNLDNEVFVDMHNLSSITIHELKYNNASRNVGFRLWYLNDVNGSIVKHHCNTSEFTSAFGYYFNDLPSIDDNSAQSCFEEVYKISYQGDNKCTDECSENGDGCYICLKKYYGTPVCSRDNFSIRPESYVVQIQDDNEGNSTAPTNIAINRSGKNSANLIAGYSYNLDINATSFNSDNAVPGYTQLFDSSNPNIIASMEWAPLGSPTCAMTSDMNVSFIMYNGKSYRIKGTSKDGFQQVGRYKFSMADQDWTSVDWNEDNSTRYNTQHHKLDGFSETADCIIDSDFTQREDNKPLGCLIKSKHEGAYQTNLDLYLRYYPYTFNIDNVKNYAGPVDNNKSIVFINTLDPNTNYPWGYKDIGNEHMAYNIQGRFKAVSYTGAELSNFTNSCYADPVNVTVEGEYLNNDVPTNTPNITYDLVVKHDDGHTVLGTSYNEKPIDTITTNYQKSYFPDDMNGSSNIDLGLNYKREFNIPLNPRVVTFKDLNITYSTNPSGLYIKQSPYAIYGDRVINKDIKFIYARALPKKKFYDDIAEQNATTPLYVALYCSLPTSQCASRGITINNTSQTRNANWYKAVNSVAVDNNISLKVSDNNFTLSDALNTTHNQINIKIDDDGANNELTVTRPAAPFSLPATVKIKGESLSRWLIYNEFDNAIPEYIYRVRFINQSNDWTGIGKTGHTIGNNRGQGKKNNKVDW